MCKKATGPCLPQHHGHDFLSIASENAVGALLRAAMGGPGSRAREQLQVARALQASLEPLLRALVL